MKVALVDTLVDPRHRTPLRLQDTELQDDIVTGQLEADDGVRYPIHNGIPRLVVPSDESQAQTSTAFGFKWKKRDTYDSPVMKANATRWLVEKYGFASLQEWVRRFAERDSVLDVGCGSGFSSSLWLDSKFWPGATMWVGVDISDAIDVAKERLGHISNTHFIQADALQLPFPDNSFDAVFSEGVLHHTPSTRAALLSAARVLNRGGEAHFYVYRRKGPVREFTDDYIRERIAPLSDEEAWEAMRTLTCLGQVLAEANTTVNVPRDVPVLGIQAGPHDIQRLVYWHFAKLYWNPSQSFEENVHINFDWYRPKYAHRQTAEEVRQWCVEARLSIQWFHEQESGFSVRAIKQ